MPGEKLLRLCEVTILYTSYSPQWQSGTSIEREVTQGSCKLARDQMMLHEWQS